MEDGRNRSYINRTALDEYLTLTTAVAVRVFDFTRYQPQHFGGWSRKRDETIEADGTDLHYRKAVEKGYASYTRGFQIARPATTPQDIHDRLHGRDEDEKRYTSFIAQDWKNNIVTEVTCNPKGLSNYFTQSDLPFEITPAFFRPEVQRYKRTQINTYWKLGRSLATTLGT